jgi:hypothetical protein
MKSITVAGMEELGGHSCLFCFTRRLERFHRNCYRARIIKVVFLEEKPRKRSSLL